MTDVEFSKLLADLASRSKVLNQKSDSINTVIERLQDRLKEFGPGIEVWLDERFDDNLAEDRRLVPNDDDETAQAQVVYTELGYARIKDVWALAVRRSHYSINPEHEPEFVWTEN